MTLKVHHLRPAPGSKTAKTRVGRGEASKGKTAGRGTKGQGKHRGGRPTSIHFEGGQMPLVRRMPKRGFRPRNRVEAEIINVGMLAGFGDGATVDPEALAKRGMIPGSGRPVKLLAEGTAPKNLTVKVNAVSAAAQKKIEDAGGRVELLA